MCETESLRRRGGRETHGACNDAEGIKYLHPFPARREGEGFEIKGSRLGTKPDGVIPRRTDYLGTGMTLGLRWARMTTLDNRLERAKHRRRRG